QFYIFSIVSEQLEAMVQTHTTTSIPESVETFHLPTILATLPIHIFTAVYITIVMVSILLTKHLETRPRRLLAINCGFFVIASFYDLAFDISYLSIVNRDQISVQECSAIRNFVYNPIATQAFVDALERFLKAFFDYDIPLAEVFALYCLFPLICIGLAIYNTFFSSSLSQNDDVCATVRRTAWTNIALILIQWGSAIVAFVMYVAIWGKVRRIRKIDITTSKPTSDGPSKMTTTLYYWNNNIVNVFFISCLLPLVLAIPSTIFTVVNIIGVVILDATTPITWTLYILCIAHIRRSIIDCIRCRARQPRETSITKITLETF
uniref:G_PROTEIN_RECEP_F1_2 domain-containing protein n=1 Tax=Haemonchus contortus TaxID=6289 RepID=A0A7I4YJP6_HAECO